MSPDFEFAFDKILRRSNRQQKRITKTQKEWEKIAAFKTGQAMTDVLLGVQGLHKVELLNVMDLIHSHSNTSLGDVHLRMKKLGSFTKDNSEKFYTQ